MQGVLRNFLKFQHCSYSYLAKVYSVIVTRLFYDKFNNLCKELNNGRAEYERCQKAALRAKLSPERPEGFR